MWKQILALAVMLTMANAITIELPSDTPYKNVSGNTITTEDYYAQIYKDYTLHYYVMNIPTATVNTPYNKSNVAATLNVSNASVYLITNMSKYAKLVDNSTDENGTVKLTYRNYTVYKTGPTVSSRVQTASGRWWLIEIKTAPLKSGSYNTTISTIKLDPTISACGFLNGANTVFTLNQSVSINGATCFTFNATNQTLDCAGWSVTGNNTASTTGATSTQEGSQGNNCNILSFATGINIGGTNQTFTNNTITTTRSSGTGVNFASGKTNMTLDCQGATLLGPNGTSTGISTSTTSTAMTVSNCIITNHRNSITPGTTTGTMTIKNTTGTATSGTNPSSLALGLSANIYIENSLFIGNAAAGACTAAGGVASNITFNNVTCNATGSGSALVLNGLSNSVFANSTFSSNSTSAITLAPSADGRNATNNVFYNNTISAKLAGSNALMPITSRASTKTGGNSFFWNNLSCTTCASYINDANGSNSYNFTINGQNEGNLYANMGSGNLTGTNQSGWNANYKVATSGSSYPYNNSTSGGKFVCSFAGCGDYAPLFYSPAAASNSCTYSSGNWVINLADGCNFTTSQSAGANTITFNGTGHASFSNASLSPLIFTASRFILTNLMCSATVPCFYFKSAVWFNGTMN
jgi:hypothetical protein